MVRGYNNNNNNNIDIANSQVHHNRTGIQVKNGVIIVFFSFYIFYQPHVHGHERRTKDKQQNRHVYHAGSVQRRLEDTRRIFEPSPVKMKSTKTASTLHSQNNRCSVITRQRTFIIPTDCYYHSYILYTYICSIFIQKCEFILYCYYEPWHAQKCRIYIYNDIVYLPTVKRSQV